MAYTISNPILLPASSSVGFGASAAAGKIVNTGTNTFATQTSGGVVTGTSLTTGTVSINTISAIGTTFTASSSSSIVFSTPLLDASGSTSSLLLQGGASIGWGPGSSNGKIMNNSGNSFLIETSGGSTVGTALGVSELFVDTLTILNNADTINLAANVSLGFQGGVSGTVRFRPASTITSYDIKLPAAQGAVGSIWINDGSGNTSFSNSILKSASTDIVLSSLLSGDVANRFQIESSGSFYLGSGAVAPDCGIIRQTTNTLRLTDITGTIFDTLELGADRLLGSTSGSITFSPPATVTTYSLIYPSAQGTSGQYLSNNGSGTFTWVSPLDQTLHTFSRNDTNSVFAAAMTLDWTAISPKLRMITWSTVISASAGATNTANFVIDTTANFGTPDGTIHPISTYWATSNSVNAVSNVSTGSSGGNATIGFNFGFSGNFTNGQNATIFSGSVVVQIT